MVKDRKDKRGLQLPLEKLRIKFSTYVIHDEVPLIKTTWNSNLSWERQKREFEPVTSGLQILRPNH